MTKPFQYKESHKLSLNVFIVFYGYVLTIIVIANITSVSATNYCIFFILGVAGILILFVKAQYKITVRNNVLEICITCPIRIIIQKLDLSDAESVEELKINSIQSAFKIERSAGNTSYLTGLPTALKLNMQGKRSYIISTIDPGSLVNLVESLNK